MKNMKDLYNIFLEHNNMIYSIDMIRLKTYIDYSKFNNIEFMIKTSYSNKVKKFWISDRVMCFKYNYVIEIEEGKSIYFGFMHNTESISYHKENICYNFTIEFNPNKLKDNSLIMYFLNMSSDWYLKSYDLAIDLPVNILDLLTDISGRCFERVDNRGFDNKTIYLGKGDGRTKIYNKKRESDLKLVGDLTRIEISREVDDFEIRRTSLLHYDGSFPCIYTNNYMYSFKDYEDKTLLAILYAVQQGFPVRDLSRVYKTKIKGLLEGGSKIKFDTKSVTNVLRRTIFFYFGKNSKIRWL